MGQHWSQYSERKLTAGREFRRLYGSDSRVSAARFPALAQARREGLPVLALAAQPPLRRRPPKVQKDAEPMDRAAFRHPNMMPIPPLHPCASRDKFVHEVFKLLQAKSGRTSQSLEQRAMRNP